MNRTTAAPALHVCESCGSDLVNPVDWEQSAPQRWTVTLHCPNCSHDRVGDFHQTEVDALDETLDEGFALLLEELQQLTRANMADAIDRFAAALEADAILPEDF